MLESVPLDVRDTAVAVLSEEEPGTAEEFSSPVDQGSERFSSPHLTRSASVGYSYDSVKPEESPSSPITIGEVIPTATTQRYRSTSSMSGL